MVTLRTVLLRWIDRAQAALLVAILVGSVLAFGGLVWWWRPALAVMATLLVTLGLARVVAEGRAAVRLSLLPVLGVLAIGLAVVQLAPLPATIGGRLSPEGRSLHARGVPERRALRDDPGAALPEATGSRAPATVDRAATLRWAFDATIGLIVLITAARFAQRLDRTMVIWGSVAAAFGLLTAFGLVQRIGGAPGLYGFLKPGHAPFWGPSTLDQLHAPGRVVLRPLADEAAGIGPWVLPRPEPAAAIGPLMGGTGAYLAMAALGLPLTLTILLQVLAPRGSREPFVQRIGQRGAWPLVALLAGVAVLGAGLVGAIAGPFLAVPFAVGIVLTGVPAAWRTGLRWSAVGSTFACLMALGAGVAINQMAGWGGDPATAPLTADPAEARRLWTEAAAIVRDFPVIGCGLGAFGRIVPGYKTTDAATTVAGSSVLQWVVESGIVGLALLGLAVVWGLGRSVRAWSRVGAADRALAAGATATVLCFGMFAAMHWSVELPAVALAACAVLGTVDRWWSGATDLFVEST